MSKIKSVEERVASIIDSEAEYFPKTAISNGVIEDRQSFEEAIVEALEGLYQDEYPMEDGVPVETYGYEAEFNSALKQAIATVRAIYQGNK